MMGMLSIENGIIRIFEGRSRRYWQTQRKEAPPLEGAVKIDVEHAGRARMICVVLKLNIDKYQYNETQLLTEAIFD